jgi:hypothetical protein
MVRSQFDDFPIRIRNSDLPQDLKQSVLAGFNRTKDEALKNISGIFEVRKVFVSEGEKLLVFMKDRQTNCKYQNNKIVFDLQEDADAFGSYMGRLLSLSKQEASWGEKIQHDTLMKAKELEGLTK